MTGTAFSRDNHYVSRGYLKRWVSSNGQVWAYRTLVSHPKVPLWKRVFTRGVAYHSHLYTRIVAGEETDEIERWLNEEFETPAEEPLQKATSDARMTPNDWTRLIRFAAAQDVRTPARFEAEMRRWQATLPYLMKETLRHSASRLEEAAQSGEPLPRSNPESGHNFPLRVIKSHEPGQEIGYIGVEILVGRPLWLWSIKRALENTSKILHQHKWTILHPPEGAAWFTSDNPVVRLNFTSPAEYDFVGGWGSPGTEIILPLGPEHLLYTQIGKRSPARGDRMPAIQAELVRRVVAEHAHRMVFAAEPNGEIPKLRPRITDPDAFRREHEQWAAWHEQQTAAERELMDRHNEAQIG